MRRRKKRRAEPGRGHGALRRRPQRPCGLAALFVWTIACTLTLAEPAGAPAGASAVTNARAAFRGEHEGKVVGFVTGHGEPSTEGLFSSVAESLRLRYGVTEVDLADTTALRSVDVVVVAGGPDVPDAELYQLDQFLMRGGRVAFLLDSATIPDRGRMANISEANIFGFLATYGVVVNADLVLDRRCARKAEWKDIVTDSRYCYWPVVSGEDIARDHPIVAGLDSVACAWTSSVTPRRSGASGRRTTVLLRSSPDSWTVPAYADLSPAERVEPPSGDDPENRVAGERGFPLAVAIEGEFTSAFKGKQVIVQHDRDVRFVTPTGMIERSRPTRMVVFGSSMPFRDDLLPQLSGSAALLVSVIDWLAAETAPSEAAARGDVRRGGAGSGDSASGGSRAAWAAAATAAAVLLAVALRRLAKARRTRPSGEARGREQR